MVSFVPMNINDEESVELVLSHVDNAIQFGEDEEPKEPRVGCFFILLCDFEPLILIFVLFCYF